MALDKNHENICQFQKETNKRQGSGSHCSLLTLPTDMKELISSFEVYRNTIESEEPM